MAKNELEPDGQARRERSPNMFVVRLWKEELGGGSEYRGSVREVSSNSFRAFRDWSDLVAFMVAHVEQRATDPRRQGGHDVSD